MVLNNLIDSAYGESSSTLSLAEREARKNLVTTLISGTTQALGGEAALANAAAAIETENNFLVIPIPVPPPPILGCDNDIVQEANKNLAAALEKTVKGIYEGSEDIAYCVMVMNSRNPDLISDYVEYLKEKYFTRPTGGNQPLNPGIYPNDARGNQLSNPLKVILESIARSHSSGSKNTQDSLPNLGKNLAAAEKADIGVTGAPSPSGWGPEDEQNAQQNDKKPSNIKLLDEKYLKKNGINAHKLKKEFLGDGPNSNQDLYLNKDTGEVWIFRRTGKGSGIPTNQFIIK